MVRRHKKIKNLEDILNYEIDLSKIDFNKEVFTLDDVLGMEIDFEKLASTMALFLVVSVVPVFSYGISEAYINQDLGFIEKDSELLAENVYVSNVISAYRAVFSPKVAEAQVATTTVTTNFVLDKTSYVWGETVQISFDSNASTTLSIKLRSPKAKFISNVVTDAPVKVGNNKFQYFIPALGLGMEKGNIFQMTLNNPNAVINQTDLFEIATSTLSVIQATSSSRLISPTIAEFTREFIVKANTQTIYLNLPETFLIDLISNAKKAKLTIIDNIVTNMDTGSTTGEVMVPVGTSVNLKLQTFVVSKDSISTATQKVNGIYYHKVSNTSDELWTNGFQVMNSLSERLKKYVEIMGKY